MTPAEQEKKLQEAYDTFMAQLDALRKERLDVIKKVVGRIEQEKISEVLESLK